MKKTLTLALLLTGTALAAAPALAKTSPKEFVEKASIGGEFEIESSQLALQKSSNDKVKAFAQQMVDDHTKVGNELKATVAKTKVDPSEVKTTLDPKHQAMLDKLKNAPAASFDHSYLEAQTSAHKEAVSLFKDYAKDGSNKDLKSFAKTALPSLEEHKQKLKDIKKS